MVARLADLLGIVEQGGTGESSPAEQARRLEQLAAHYRERGEHPHGGDILEAGTLLRMASRAAALAGDYWALARREKAAEPPPPGPRWRPARPVCGSVP